MPKTIDICVKAGVCVLALAALSQISLAEKGCNIKESTLNLRYKTGQIKPDTYPYNFSANQHCQWTFPNDKFPDRAAFIFISEMDLQNDSKVAGDITIGESFGLQTMPNANCRLYGENIKNINTTALDEFVTTKHETRDRFCSAWFISNQTLDRVVFRSEGKQGDVFRKRGFFLFYSYIDVRKKESTLSEGETAVTQMKYHTTAADTLTSTSDHSSVHMCPDSQSSIHFVIIAILAGLLLITITVLIFFANRHRSSNYKIPSSSRKQSLNGEGDHTNAAYSSIDPANRSPVEMYDVPMNNRMRAPTIVSVASSMSENPYQFPSNRPVDICEAIPEHDTPEVKDVYAVVQKDKKQ